MVLDVVADVARQDEERFESGRHRGSRHGVLALVGFDRAVLAYQADVLSRDVPGAEGHQPKPDEPGPRAEVRQSAGN